MAKLYDRNSAERAHPAEPEALLAGIQTFLGACRTPAVLEYGEEIVALKPDQYTLETRSGRLWLEVWTETRGISRRILSIERQAAGVLDCTVHRFGGKPGKLSFLDLDRPQTAHKSLSGIRQNFSEQFRRMLFRQFPGWEIESISCGPDLQRSFSSLFPRARLTRGNQQIAAVACPASQEEPAMLTFALVWLDHVSGHGQRAPQTSLCLFLPETAGNLTAHRLRWLTGQPLRPRIFRFNGHGAAGEVDPQDLGNLETRVSPHYACPHVTPEIAALLSRLTAVPGVGCCPELNGDMSIRSRGAEFARIQNGKLYLGLERKQQMEASRMGDVENFAVALSHMGESAGSPQAAQGVGPPSFPERWLESAVRSNITAIDPALLPSPIHGQVLTFAGGDRDLIDLLAVSPAGRLSVLEMKVSEDIHLPLQALDYWMRVRWHGQRGELQHLFPGIALADTAPKLVLLAPAMSFHSSTATILRYFSPEIEVERVGVNSGWHQQFKVVLRLLGADKPISHGNSHGHRRSDEY